MNFPKKTIKDVNLQGKTVLLRADYNLPLDASGKISDEYRLTESLPTLKYLLKQQCRLVIISHLGRPDGAVKSEFSLKPVAKRLGELLEQKVDFVPECIGDQVVQAVKQLKPGEIVLLENLRFHPEEEANDTAFAKQLAKDSGADYFVQDGFGVVHRGHASTAAITGYLPSVAGLLLEKEYVAIESAMRHPKKPLVAILGGAKVSDKIKIIHKFVELADQLIIGGAMANTFLAYRGHEIGKSLYEPDQQVALDDIYQAASDKVGPSKVDDFLLLPSDARVAESSDSDAKFTVVLINDVQQDDRILDIGPASAAAAKAKIAQGATIIWNGTLGRAELPQFALGSAAVAEAIDESRDATSIIGGGDTADFVLGWDKRTEQSFSHISTGGGASLELMAGDTLPGIAALMNA